MKYQPSASAEFCFCLSGRANENVRFKGCFRLLSDEELRTPMVTEPKGA